MCSDHFSKNVPGTKLCSCEFTFQCRRCYRRGVFQYFKHRYKVILLDVQTKCADFQTITYSYFTEIPESVCKLIKTLFEGTRSSQNLLKLGHHMRIFSRDHIEGAGLSHQGLPIASPPPGLSRTGQLDRRELVKQEALKRQ